MNRISVVFVGMIIWCFMVGQSFAASSTKSASYANPGEHYSGAVGFLFQLTSNERSPCILLETAKELPVKKFNESKSVPIHSDLKVLSDSITQSSDGVLVTCTGTLSYNSLPYTEKMTPMAGLPGTRLDITGLERFHYLGKWWVPKSGETAIILITKDSIDVSGCMGVISKLDGPTEYYNCPDTAKKKAAKDDSPKPAKKGYNKKDKKASQP